MKATHQGNCQVCMNNQKLPNGVLSKHGYTTKWGFFSGTCTGSHNLPYEKSCELVKELIITMQEKIVDLQDIIVAVKALPSNIGYHHQYVKSTKDQWNNTIPGHYRWVIGKFFNNETYQMLVQFTSNDGTAVAIDKSHSGDIAAVATKENVRYITGIQNKIDNIQSYIDMQQKRVDDWIEKELTPV